MSREYWTFRHLFPSMWSLDLFAVLWTSPNCKLTSIMIIKRDWWEKHRRLHDHHHDHRRHHDYDYNHPAISGMSATRPGPVAINFRARSAPCLGVAWHILCSVNFGFLILLSPLEKRDIDLCLISDRAFFPHPFLLLHPSSLLDPKVVFLNIRPL